MCSNAGGGSGGSSAGANAGNSRLKQGEKPFASFAPTGLHPNGEPIIAQTADGGYRYLGNIPAWDSIRVDSDSSEYKQAQRDFNVKAQMDADGKITVKKGGLYDRSKTYKDAESFRKDVKKRIDSRSSFDKRERDSLTEGRISQITAEYYRGVVKKNSSSMALKKISEGIKNDMQSVKTRIEVADKAKRKADQAIDSMKRQLQIRFGQ